MMSLDNIPPEIQTLLDGASFHIVSSGASGAQVYRILRPDGSACYLKAADVPW